MSDDRDDDRDGKDREQEAEALEREAEALARDRERVAKAFEREAKELEREQEREKRELERAAKALEREAEALGRERERMEKQRERAEKERERAARQRERAEHERRKAAEQRRRAGDPAAIDDVREPDDAAAQGDSGDEAIDEATRWWSDRHDQLWGQFDRAWRRHAEHRRRWESRRAEHRARWRKSRRRWKELHAEREMWMRTRKHKHDWGPWWLQARIRRRIFSWLALAFAIGVIGARVSSELHWWHVVLAVVGLSMASGMIAFRLTHPLIMVIRAAQDIGDGKLDTRLDAESHRGETRLLAIAINEMAARIEQQVKDQRQLLAAVSHELRTPLGHMRVLIDTARANHDRKALGELEAEVLMLDDLVGRLLASSRLEFGNLDCRPIDLGQLVSDATTSACVAPELIEAIGDVRAAVDPTLVRRAVANLLDNARVHGGGAVAVRIERRGAQVAIEVDDAGPGVAPDRRADAFRAFVPSRAGGLGLGLALVSRIAVAHNGGAWITDRPGGGARVGFTVEVAPRTGTATAG